MRNPCLDCGTPTDSTRCQKCGAAFNRGRNHGQHLARKQKGGRPQYGGDWARYSKAIRDNATHCWICGKGPNPSDPWQADHILPAEKYGGIGPARAAHRSCNVARSNRARANKNKTQPTD